MLVDAEKALIVPSIEDNALVMEEAVSQLVENRVVTKIVYVQRQDYEYDYDQTQLLAEVARVYRSLVHDKSLSLASLSVDGISSEVVNTRYTFLNQLVQGTLKADPISAYLLAKRELRKSSINKDKSISDSEEAGWDAYMSALKKVVSLIEKTSLYQKLEGLIEGTAIHERTYYRKVFFAQIKPDFMFTKVLTQYPKGAEEIDSYSIGDTEVTIFRLPDTVHYLYHLTPPEFKLSDDQYELLETARRILSDHKPTEDDFVNPSRMRSVFSNVGRDLLEELAVKQEVTLSESELEKLTDILIRYTVGFGLIEVLLSDEHIQDVTINSPTGRMPIFLVHSKYEDCKTNIIPTIPEVESWASKLRMISGRPLDEANPILDADITIPGVASARVGAIGRPLDNSGLAFAFRRHRDKPWTLALFVKNRMITSLAAGLLSFLIDGNRTFLVAGTRSAGKSSLLGGFLVEIMRKYRIITIEDTLELPVYQLQDLGYNIQSLKVGSALAGSANEVSAADGIRTTLRLGDSCLIVGEVRSTEARALYEAMRVGALANVVAGTIHGDSPYGVFDRVVNDLEVPRTSFKATDIIVVANPVRSADGLSRVRRVTEIAEVRKHWEDDPLVEGGFVSLMKYNPVSDELEPTDALINGESEIIKSIAGRVKQWSGSWEAVWADILLRAKAKQVLVDAAVKLGDDRLLEAEFVIQANDAYHKIAERIRSKGGYDEEEIIREFSIWIQRNTNL